MDRDGQDGQDGLDGQDGPAAIYGCLQQSSRPSRPFRLKERG